MSTLNDKIAAHLEHYFPTEFDEKWVNKLLTDTESKANKPKHPPKNTDLEKASLKDMAMMDAELRKQRIIRKTKLMGASDKEKPAELSKASTLSAIEKQKQAFNKQKRQKAAPAKGGDSPRILPRFTKRSS